MEKYNVLAAINNLLESYSVDKYYEPTFILKNKSTILEHLVEVPKTETSQILESFNSLDKNEQKMVFEIMVDKFKNFFENHFEITNNDEISAVIHSE